MTTTTGDTTMTEIATDLQALYDRANAALGEDASYFDSNPRGTDLRRLMNAAEELFWTVHMDGSEDEIAEAQRVLTTFANEILAKYGNE
jgi:hypothetical protein